MRLKNFDSHQVILKNFDRKICFASHVLKGKYICVAYIMLNTHDTSVSNKMKDKRGVSF